jgi:hypothetical protein
MPNFEGAVNPLERRGPTVIQLLLQELSGLRAPNTRGLARSLPESLGISIASVALSTFRLPPLVCHLRVSCLE